MRSSGNGLASLQCRLNAIPRAVRTAVAKETVKAAEQMATQMRSLAPEDTGDLIASIAVTKGGRQTPPYSQPGGSLVVPENAAAITVGSDKVRYPHLVEYGTSKAEAQPFFWPVVRLGNKKARAKIKRAITKAIKESK